jgi:hypothetical protein
MPALERLGKWGIVASQPHDETLEVLRLAGAESMVLTTPPGLLSV